jgi:hypothetical protein
MGNIRVFECVPYLDPDPLIFVETGSLRLVISQLMHVD